MSVYKHELPRLHRHALLPLWTRILVARALWFRRSLVIQDHGWAFHRLPRCPAHRLPVGIYLANNPAGKSAHRARKPARLQRSMPAFFSMCSQIQCWFALVLSAWIAPRLITFDLADNALPILLSHPISRFGYVFGKFVALFAFALRRSHGFPCLLLFAYQGYSSPQPWAGSQSPHRRRPACRVRPLDYVALDSRPGAFVLGQVERSSPLASSSPPSLSRRAWAAS